MGTPNNQPMDPVASAILRHVINGDSIPSGVMRSTGLDIEVLKKVLELVRPQLRYLSGYISLEQADHTGELSREQGCDGMKSWQQVIARSGIDASQYQYVLQTGSPSFTTETVESRYDTLRVYPLLVRDGTWILSWSFGWAPMQEALVTCGDAESLIETIYQLARRFKATPHLEDAQPGEERSSVALRIAASLTRILRDTVAERQRRLDEMNRVTEQVSGLMGRVRIYYPA